MKSSLDPDVTLRCRGRSAPFAEGAAGTCSVDDPPPPPITPGTRSPGGGGTKPEGIRKPRRHDTPRPG